MGNIIKHLRRFLLSVLLDLIGSQIFGSANIVRAVWSVERLSPPITTSPLFEPDWHFALRCLSR